MSAWAVPGAKCVCVKRGEWTLRVATVRPVFGQKLTIRSSYLGCDGNRYLRFAEIVNAPIHLAPGFIEPGFRVDRFRPIVTKTQEQDVAKFRHLLTPSPIDAGLVPAGVDLDA